MHFRLALIRCVCTNRYFDTNFIFLFCCLWLLFADTTRLLLLLLPWVGPRTLVQFIRSHRCYEWVDSKVRLSAFTLLSNLLQLGLYLIHTHSALMMVQRQTALQFFYYFSSSIPYMDWCVYAKLSSIYMDYAYQRNLWQMCVRMWAWRRQTSGTVSSQRMCARLSKHKFAADVRLQRMVWMRSMARDRGIGRWRCKYREFRVHRGSPIRILYSNPRRCIHWTRKLIA